MSLIHDIFTLTAVTISGAPDSGVALGRLMDGADPYDGGTYLVAGTTVIDGAPDVPVYRKVRLHDKPTGRVVRQAWSDPITGAFSFPHMRIGPWVVIAHDHTGSFNAVIADAVYGVAE